MELLISKPGFAVLTTFAITPWLIAAYWHLLLMKRLHIVARQLYPIPENIPWNVRGATAQNHDAMAHKLAKKRNLFALIFVAVLIVEAVLLGIATCLNNYCI